MFLEKNRIGFIFQRVSLRVREGKREERSSLRLQLIKRDRWISDETNRSSYFSRIKELRWHILCSAFNTFFRERERKKKKKRLSTTRGMTRLLGEGLKGDSGQRLLFICYSLSMSFIGIQHLLKSSNHLKTSHYLHFSTEFYIVRKVERIILNFFWQKKKDPKTRERRVEKIVILYLNRNKCPNKKKKK